MYFKRFRFFSNRVTLVSEISQKLLGGTLLGDENEALLYDHYKAQPTFSVALRG